MEMRMNGDEGANEPSQVTRDNQRSPSSFIANILKDTLTPIDERSNSSGDDSGIEGSPPFRYQDTSQNALSS